ncbi:hypothetical protein [Pseudomonas sp. CC6-YY-74]|uniref:hypothetical protein n=1 Tax=Pseudomonas sp. CC6-YY-74 TaxID=1930532 RepID=UPI0009A1DBC5|nr:hypothetical protein [Pseudomonas sp. CC6-YY-74]
MRVLGSVLVMVCIVLTGCGDSSAVGESENVAMDGQTSQNIFRKDSVVIGEGQSLGIDGRIVSYDLIRNDKGAFDRYAIESNRSLMGLEGEVYVSLVRLGYSRRVRQESAVRYVVNYLKKGAPALVADYRAEEGMVGLQRLILTIKIDG